MADEVTELDPQMFRQGGLRLASKLFAPGNLRADEQQLRRLREFAQLEDPLADDVVAMIRGLPGGQGRELFDRAAADGIDSLHDPPHELVTFFRSVEATPYWVDVQRLERGARAITRVGLIGLFPLGDMALMGGYLASRAAKPLMGTGELERMTGHRLIETAAWWIKVTTPGAMARGADGYRAALHVRLVHAHVRAAMNERSDWDYEEWDRPVNQVQTTGTLLLFSLVYMLGTRLLGVRYSERERADIMYLWRYIGWLMGVDPQLLPATEEDAWRMLWLLAKTEFIPDEDSKKLAAALLNSHAGNGKLLGRISLRVHSSISRLVLGKENADYLDVPDTPLTQGVVLSAAVANFAAETVRTRVPGATLLQERLGAFGRNQYLTQLRKALGQDPDYAPRTQPTRQAA